MDYNNNRYSNIYSDIILIFKMQDTISYLVGLWFSRMIYKLVLGFCLGVLSFVSLRHILILCYLSWNRIFHWILIFSFWSQLVIRFRYPHIVRWLRWLFVTHYKIYTIYDRVWLLYHQKYWYCFWRESQMCKSGHKSSNHQGIHEDWFEEL